MNRCYVSEQIAAHCNEPEEILCPYCESTMICEDGEVRCLDEYEEGCDHVILPPDEDDFH